MIDDLLAEFARRFGRPAEAAARAPGRVNLIGEHTDYNDGLVLPLAIDRETVAAAAARADGRVRVFSRETGETAEFEVAAPGRADHWSDYVKGVCWALAEREAIPGGFDLAVSSSVPPESGLSSSAALELAVVTVLDDLWSLGLDGLARSRIAHRAESGFVGVPCGLMDQLVSGLGRRDAALRIDCRSLEIREIPLPSDRVRILISHSGVRRALSAAGYGDRREECVAALREARAAARNAGAPEPGSLRDVGLEALPALSGSLSPTLLRRARHVVTENARVDATCRSLLAGDFSAAGEALRAGMCSLRDDFEVSTPELDALCEIGDSHPSVYGSRLTGAGLGGCVLHLVATGAEDDVSRIVAAGFEARFGRRPPIFAVRACDGASALEVAAGRGG